MTTYSDKRDEQLEAGPDIRNSFLKKTGELRRENVKWYTFSFVVSEETGQQHRNKSMAQKLAQKV
jgi:hypothetical protein